MKEKGAIQYWDALRPGVELPEESYRSPGGLSNFGCSVSVRYQERTLQGDQEFEFLFFPCNSGREFTAERQRPGGIRRRLLYRRNAGELRGRQ